MSTNKLLNSLKSFAKTMLGKTAFLNKLKNDAKILDVGCGNDSPIRTKIILPNCKYTGIDIENYNQSLNPVNVADKYIMTNSKNFSKSISQINELFDAIISTHNIEHCEERELVLKNMCDKIKPGGLLYLTFPSEDTIEFPSRNGTLNYYDDNTHLYNPPEFNEVLKILK